MVEAGSHTSENRDWRKREELKKEQYIRQKQTWATSLCAMRWLLCTSLFCILDRVHVIVGLLCWLQLVIVMPKTIQSKCCIQLFSSISCCGLHWKSNSK